MLEELSPHEVFEMLEDNEIVLIDVRTPLEFGFERIAGSLNAPMATLDPAKLPRDEKRPVVLHCGSGIRSAKVGALLLESGFDTMSHMVGGLNSWKKAKLPTAAVNPITGNMEV